MLHSLERVWNWKNICWVILVGCAMVFMLSIILGGEMAESGYSKADLWIVAPITAISVFGIIIGLVTMFILAFIEWYFNYFWRKRDRYVVESVGGDCQTAFAYFEPRGAPRDGQIGKWQKGCMVIINPDASNGIPYWIKEEADQRRYVEFAQKANAVELNPTLVFENPQQIGAWLNQESLRLGTL